MKETLVIVRNCIIGAVAVLLLLPAAGLAGELPCSLTKADYASLANTESKATPDSVKKLSKDDQEMLCDTRAHVDLIHRKRGEIEARDITPWHPKFLTTAERVDVERAEAKSLARGLQPMIDAVTETCRKNPNAEVCKRQGK
jgi:hypothetical protein